MDQRRTVGPDELVAGTPDAAPGRRRVWWVAGLLVAAGVLALVRPDVSLVGERMVAPPTAVPSATSNPNVTPRLDGVQWAPRGDLVGDTRFVTAALQRIRLQRMDATRVYFAGRLPDGSRLMLAGTDVNRGMVATSVHALHVPRDLPVGAAVVTEASVLTDPQQVLAWATRNSRDEVQLLAISRPGPVRFEVSGKIEFAADGTPRRSWTELHAEDGVAVVGLGRDADPIVTVRAAGPGVFTLPLVVRVTPRAPVAPVLKVSGVALPGYRGPTALSMSRALRAGAGALVDLASARREVIWSGAPWKQRRLALVLVTRPDGQRFQALVGEQDGVGFPAGVRALPRGASARLPWLLEPFSPQDPTLLLCPTGPGTLVLRRDGRAPRTLPVRADGVAALVAPGPSPPSASGARVTLLDPDGEPILITTLPEPGFDNPLALD